jgi:hypothetical protein
MSNLQKLKHLLLNEGQLKCFEKYYLNYYSEFDEDEFLIKKGDFLSMFERADSSFSNFMNERLVNLSEKEIYSCFKGNY